MKGFTRCLSKLIIARFTTKIKGRLDIMTQDKPTIGFIGTGVMGKSMAKNLQHAGYSLQVYTRTKAKAQTLIDNGATWKDSVSELAKSAKIIITMVGYPKD